MKCKDCKHFNNKIPVSTEKGTAKYSKAEDYIGFCEKINRPVLMNDDYRCEEE